MRTVLSIAMTLALAVAWGCQSSSTRGGGVSSDEGFKIVVPTFATELKQGETQSVPISLERGGSFKRDVKLEVKSSKGIGVEPGDLLVKAGDKPESQVRVTAAKDAAIGNYRVYVKGTPATGEPTTAEFNVKVVAP